MTQRGELITQKGDIYESAFHPRKQRILSFTRYCGKIQDFSFEQEAINTEINYKMIFVLKGDLHCSNAGASRPFIMLNNQQHNLITIRKDTILKTSNENEEVELIMVNLSASFLASYLPPEHPAIKTFLNSEDNVPKLFSKQNLFITPEISAILSSIENSLHVGFCKALFLESKVIELLVLQFVQLEQSSAEELPGKLKREEIDKMNEIREILISDSNSQHSLRTLAHMVGTNEFNLKKNFKLVFGTTVYGYLNQYKMEEAKKMLVSGQHNVSEVSGKMGYKHATHFTNAFKKYFGYLPTKLKLSFLMFDPEFLFVFFTA